MAACSTWGFAHECDAGRCGQVCAFLQACPIGHRNPHSQHAPDRIPKKSASDTLERTRVGGQRPLRKSTGTFTGTMVVNSKRVGPWELSRGLVKTVLCSVTGQVWDPVTPLSEMSPTSLGSNTSRGRSPEEKLLGCAEWKGREVPQRRASEAHVSLVALLPQVRPWQSLASALHLCSFTP